MRQTLFEIKNFGTLWRVAAIDVATNIEVVVSVPSNTPPEQAKQHAFKRLQYVLRQKNIIAD